MYFTLPAEHNFNILSKFHSVTFYGIVSEFAIFSGTPSSSSAKLESGLITLLAEKSTLFPMRC